MEFLTSDWFTWVVAVVLIGSIFAIISESFEDSWSDIWHYTKKILGFFAAMVLLPVIIIFGETKSKTTKTKKGPPS